MIKVEFLPAAREEILAVAERYDAETPRLGEVFLAEVERAVERITAFPAHGSPYLADTRRVLLRRFGLDHRSSHVPPTDTELWAVPTLQKLGNQQLGFVGWALPTKRWPKR